MSSIEQTEFLFANKESTLNVDLKYVKSLDEVTLKKNDSILLLGKAKDLRKISVSSFERALGQVQLTREAVQEAIQYVSASVKSSDGTKQENGSHASLNNRFVLSKIPNNVSRHDTPSRAHAVSKAIADNSYGTNQLVVVACERAHSVAYASAIARAYPLFTAKTDKIKSRQVFVNFVYTDATNEKGLSDEELKCFSSVSESVRLAAKIVDTPCANMHADCFLEEVKLVAKELGIEPMVIQGEELNERGFGGLYNVGKAALNTPKLVVLSHLPSNAKRTIAWVGKGIVFDTGGLNLKPRTGMCTMKIDCGGAAGILGAFYTAVKLGFKDNLHAIFCLAENAIGPAAYRPDDIIKLYSGKTVEINNTDAEGRLVLGDGVAYASRDLKADVIVDMATLTGAQAIVTGRYHAGLMTNNPIWEEAAFNAGKASADLCFPYIYCPELHFSEFKSVVADMKNSVAKADNAPSACAGLFIQSHLDKQFKGIWIHLDIAAPVCEGERATGYGVALLNTLFGDSSENGVFSEIGKKDVELPLINLTEENDD